MFVDDGINTALPPYCQHYSGFIFPVMRYMPRCMEKFRDIVKNGRKAKRLSQTAFGELAGGYDQRTVSDWESGKSAQVRNVEALANALGIEESALEEAINQAIAENPNAKRISPRFRKESSPQILPLDSATARNHVKEITLVARTDKIYGERDVPVSRGRRWRL